MKNVCKKLIVIFIAMFIPLNVCYAKVYDYFSGMPVDGHLPSCATITCPECHKKYMQGASDGGLALRTLKSVGKDDKGLYLEYRCEHGHTIHFYYRIDEATGNPVPLEN